MFKPLSLVILLVASCGCAIHYYDPETKAEHIYGIGHMVMKAEPSNSRKIAVVNGVNTLGFGVGTLSDGAYMGAGWSSRRHIRVLDNTEDLQLIWPNADWFNLRVGDSFNPVIK